MKYILNILFFMLATWNAGSASTQIGATGIYIQDDGNVGVGSTNPKKKLDLDSGEFRSTSGVTVTINAGAGKVLVSDAVGLGTWMPASTLPATGGTAFVDITGNATDNSSLSTALSGKVATTRTVNGHALSADVSVTKSDLSLGSVENTAVSTWAGTSNIVTIGTVTTGTWTAGNIGIGTTKTTTAGLTVMNGNLGIGTWVPASALTVIGTVTANTFATALEAQTGTCAVNTCTATATCTAGKVVVWGGTGTTATNCTTSPSGCNAGWCTPGLSTCARTEAGTENAASVWAVCGKVN